MRTTDVITCSSSSQALHVDVVERGLHEMRGLLVGHRATAVERGLVRIERVRTRQRVVLVECLLELVDRELDAVTRRGADHEAPSRSEERRVGKECRATVLASRLR